MRKSLATLCTAVALGAALVLVASALAATRPPDGLYAESSAAIDAGEYSNGAVDLQVIKGGRQIEGAVSGVACYTGEDPPTGVPTNDEVKIHLPRNLTIAGDGSFSWSGPVTLGPEETQYEELTLKTTYTIKGRFKAGRHGSYTVTGTDSSPICQPTTVKKITAKLYRE